MANCIASFSSAGLHTKTVNNHDSLGSSHVSLDKNCCSDFVQHKQRTSTPATSRLPARALAVNMSIDKALDGKPTTPRRQRQLDKLQQFTIVKDSLVIPFTTKVPGERKHKEFHCFPQGQPRSNLSSVHVNEPFPHELAFACTIHKAQGRTMKLIVIDMTDQLLTLNNLKHAALFVAFSRVRSASCLRRLAHRNENPNLALKHIPSLRPDFHAAAFISGYVGDSTLGQTWDPLRALNSKRKFK